MRAKLITIVLVLSGLLVNANVSYGCNSPPEAVLKVSRQYVIAHVIASRGAVLDGSGSYDLGGSIVKFEFDVDGDGSYDYWENSSFYPDGAFDGRTIHIYSSNTVYTVKLRVTDNSSLTDTGTCEVHVGPDSDNDDMPDEWETIYGLVVGTDDAEGDKDTDGYNNLCEYLHGTNPAGPGSKPNGPSYIITMHVPTDARTIQRAIDASIDGDTIMVAEGTYTPVTSDWFDFHGKAITLRSTNPDVPSVVAATIIDCKGTSSDYRCGFYFYSNEGPGSVLAGFTITNGYYDYGGGIYCEDASPTITNCVISNNTTCYNGYGGGMYVVSDSDPQTPVSSPMVKNCIFARNEATYGGGVFIYQSSPTLVNCIFIANLASDGGGVHNYNSSTKLINCTFNQNRAVVNGSGLYNVGGSSPQITNCIVWGNENTQINYYGQPPVVTYSCIQGGFSGTGNTGADPRFINAEDPAGPDGISCTLDDGLCLKNDSPYSPCIDKGSDSAVPTDITTDIIGNPRKADGDHQVTTPDGDNPTVDMGAYEVVPVWYVNGDVASSGNGKSWANAFKYLQDILSSTNLKAGDEVWVAEGLYKPGPSSPDPRKATFQLKIGVSIYGGFTGNEVCRPQRDWVNNATILSGDIDGDGLPDNDNSYNVVKGANNATLDGFTITGGNASGSNPYDRGGGVYCSNTSPKISNSVITGNKANYYGGGIYCYNASPVVTNCKIANNTSASYGGGVANAGGISSFISCVFSENSATSYYGGGMYNYSNASPIILNCIFSQNSSPNMNGGGMYNNNSSPTVTNCLFSKNSAKYCGGMYNYGSGSKPSLTNCTFSKNSATNGLGGGMYNYYSSSPTVTNCILWGDTVGTVISEIYNYSSNPTFSHCDIQGCGGSSVWGGTSFGTDLGGNIDQDPLFADSDNPAGTDGVLGTSDDGLRLKGDSPCIDAANGNMATDTDVLEDERRDIDFVLNTGIGDPDYTDIGAYEYDNSPGYTTSFEIYQGYAVYNTIDGIDGWQAEPENSATVCEAQYKYGPGDNDYHKYQHVRVSSNSTISYDTGDSCDKTFVRINCIPSPGSFINIMNGSSLVASIKFEQGGTISVWNNGSYATATQNYLTIANRCRTFLSGAYGDPEYSYENTWIEFTIQFNWKTHTYDVSWVHYAEQDGADIYTGAKFSYSNRCFTKVEFITGADSTSFELNRISISDMPSVGGVVGPDEDDDAWLIAPEANILNPLKGRCIVAGPMWYDVLGEYIVKCCPADLDSADPDNWITVCSGKSVSKDAITLGYWNTEAFYNGDYFLKIEVYDDLGQKHNEGIITVDRSFNGRPHEPCKVKYPVIGRAKARTFHYEELPDFTINWPGTFPFEFKRTYNNGLRARLLPLFFGWTHNHNIRLIEDCTFDWIINSSEKPVSDTIGLGVGRLWLCMPLGGEMFIGQVNGSQVKYTPLDNENRYIIRTSRITQTYPESRDVEVTYTYYTSDGMTMKFVKEFNVSWPDSVPTDEGLVDWMVAPGIDTQEDRFGNYLEYKWTDEENKEQPIEMYLEEISNNRTPANLRFTYGLFGILCSEIRLYNDDDLTDGYVSFFASIGSDEATYKAALMRDASYYPPTTTSEYRYSRGQEFMLTEIIPNDSYETDDVFYINVKHNDDGTLIERRERIHYESYLSHQPTEQYTYEYDGTGNLITTIQVKSRDDSLLTPLREEVVVTSPEGALLRTNTRTQLVIWNGQQQFEPYNYKDYYYWYDPDNFGFHAGGGKATDIEYSYEDNSFPLKPTKIIEYFHNGLGQYDRIRTTTRKYDQNRGNLIEQKVYVDSVNYVYTQYAYHQVYDFPIQQITWKGFCHDDGIGGVVTSGAKVEKKWLYGDADGTPAGGGSQGNYLVQERTLLDETTDKWADTSYTYYAGGQIKQKHVLVDDTIVPQVKSIACFEIDTYGFVSKEWQGATLEGGLPTGNPQKRYYYDGLGRKILEADYLGKVQMNVYDSLGRITQARQYFDATAITREDFEPDSYDERPLYDDYDNPPYQDDWWQTRTLYSDYGPWNKPGEITLPTGGITRNQYLRYRNNISLNRYSIVDDLSGNVYYVAADDGRMLEEVRFSGVWDWDTSVRVINIYDSMRRLLHKYSYFDDINPYREHDLYKYIKHEEYRYDASGNKTYEAVYKVERTGTLEQPTFVSVLEKANSYEYDILGRLTKQVIDEGGLNQTTKYGYDAVGNRIYVIDPAGKVIFSDYDNANRKIREYFAAEPVYSGEVIDFEATNPTVRKEIRYYNNNKIKDVTSYDYGGTTVLSYTEYTYDSRGRIWTVTEKINASQSATTLYDYSDDGSLERVLDDSGYHIVIQDAEGKKTGIRLSYHGKPEIITYPSGDYEEYSYYSIPLQFNQDGSYTDLCMYFNGLLEKKTVWVDGAAKHIRYTYDDYGKVQDKIYDDDDPQTQNDPYLEYSYTSRILGEYGMVKQVSDHRAEIDRPGGPDSPFTFDYWYLSGKVKTYTDYDGYSVYYDYSCAYDQPTEVKVTDSLDNLIYYVKYSYDLAGRLTDVSEPLLGDNNLIAGFAYDDNGNRDILTYSLNGSELLNQSVSINYDYNLDNLLTGYNTSSIGVTGPTFSLSNVVVDGLGRLVSANETITKVNNVGTINYLLNNFANPDDYPYDMRSQLIKARIERTTAPTSVWEADYTYRKDGNLHTRQETGMSQPATFEYDFDNNGNDDGDIMTGAHDGENFSLGWDWNGNMILTDMASGDDTTLEYNWDNKLRHGQCGSSSIDLKYDPMGNRVLRTANGVTRKYIIDISGDLPVILMELDTQNNIQKTYIYANGEILAQHDGPHTAARYFYLHDRLGSIRQVINQNGSVEKYYTFEPFGKTLEEGGTLTNSFMFTGQYYDSEIAEYYLRARQYDPQLMRFTSRDPAEGIYEYPLTLHRYIYCQNDSINLTDPSGEMSAYDLTEDVLVGSAAHSAATDTVALGVWYDQDYLVFLGIAMHNEIGTIMEMHHVYPEFLGGEPGGIRVPLPTELHYGKGPSSLHNKIYEQLLNRFGKLNAERGWRTDQWQKMFSENPGTRQEALQILMNIYMNFDTRYSLWLTISLIKQIKSQDQAWW